MRFFRSAWRAAPGLDVPDPNPSGTGRPGGPGPPASGVAVDHVGRAGGGGGGGRRPGGRAVGPKLDPKPAVVEKLAALKPNHGVPLGQADVVGDFNDTARKYDLHRTGPRGRDFTIKMCWAPDRRRT